jgi:hypothetical protein
MGAITESTPGGGAAPSRRRARVRQSGRDSVVGGLDE